MSDAKEQKNPFPFDKVQAAVLACFAMDAYGLSYHWVYDQSLIPSNLPDSLQNPHSEYHKAKSAGDLTFFGDQLLALLQSIAEKKRWDRADFAARLAATFNANYQGHISKAIKYAVKQINDKVPLPLVGQGGEQDTSALGMNAALALVSKTRDEFIVSGREHSAMTHNAPLNMLATDFANEVYVRVLGGKAPVAAIQDLIKEKPYKESLVFVDQVEKGLASKNKDTNLAIRTFGLACYTHHGISSLMHLIAKYENDLQGAIKANVVAGGDCNGRGLPLAMIIGAHVGTKQLPPYLKDIKRYDEIMKLINTAASR